MFFAQRKAEPLAKILHIACSTMTFHIVTLVLQHASSCDPMLHLPSELITQVVHDWSETLAKLFLWSTGFEQLVE